MRPGNQLGTRQAGEPGWIVEHGGCIVRCGGSTGVRRTKPSDALFNNRISGACSTAVSNQHGTYSEHQGVP